ncbi:MAG: hypothetical protein WB988_13455, partial [Candidatus Nitrosopolaris sp.]
TAYKTSSYNSTEANSKLRMRKAFTVNNFATFVTGGGGGTLNSTKNGANGNIIANLNSAGSSALPPGARFLTVQSSSDRCHGVNATRITAWS